MDPEKPPAYSETSTDPYKQLVNEAIPPYKEIRPIPYDTSMQNVYPPQNSYQPPMAYVNMVPNPSQLVFANMQQPAPAVQPATTVNVNTGPIEKRYCCSCCCTCFWIIVIVLVILGAIQGALH